MLLSQQLYDNRSFLKFCKTLQKYQNSTKKAKLCGSAQNSVARGKLFALVITLQNNLQ